MNNNARTLIIGVTVIVCMVVAGCVAAFVASPDGANTGQLVTILLGSLAPTIAAIAALVGVGKVDGKADQMLNGVMDAKIIQRNLHTVLDERVGNDSVTPLD